MKSDSIVMNGTVLNKEEDAIGEEVHSVDIEEKENRMDNSMTSGSHEDVSLPPAKTTRRKRKATGTKITQKTDTVIARKVRNPRSKRTSVLRVQEQKRPFASPDFKIPQPTLGHSTPGDLAPSTIQRRDSLFGFGALESPLVLSPVSSMLGPHDKDETNDFPESRGSPEEISKDKSGGQRLLGTYDIPIRKPTPKNKKRNTKQKNKRVSQN